MEKSFKVNEMPMKLKQNSKSFPDNYSSTAPFCNKNIKMRQKVKSYYI